MPEPDVPTAPSDVRLICDELERRFSRDERLGIVATLLLPFVEEEGPLYFVEAGITGGNEPDPPPLAIVAARERRHRRSIQELAAFEQLDRMGSFEPAALAPAVEVAEAEERHGAYMRRVVMGERAD